MCPRILQVEQFTGQLLGSPFGNSMVRLLGYLVVLTVDAGQIASGIEDGSGSVGAA